MERLLLSSSITRRAWSSTAWATGRKERLSNAIPTCYRQHRSPPGGITSPTVVGPGLRGCYGCQRLQPNSLAVNRKALLPVQSADSEMVCIVRFDAGVVVP